MKSFGGNFSCDFLTKRYQERVRGAGLPSQRVGRRVGNTRNAVGRSGRINNLFINRRPHLSGRGRLS